MTAQGAAVTAAGTQEELLRAEDVVVEFRTKSGAKVHAVSGVSFAIHRGETLGLVGESGCGKSTTGRAVMRLVKTTGGSVHFSGRDITHISAHELRAIRSKLQMIFQDPISSLNPRRKVRDIVAEGLMITGAAKPWADRVDKILDEVGLDPEAYGDRRPHQLSGGQCQRVAIARALVLDPDVIVCDEPVSALDVSVQAQILNLLEDMKERYRLTLLFIAHDLAVVKNISDRIAVMYLGRMCEIGPSEELCANPLHPYTRALLEAVPTPDPDVPLEPLGARGDLPSPLNPPSGCRYRTRCPKAQDVCAEDEPLMREVAAGRFVACHFPATPIDVENVTMEQPVTVTAPGGTR